MLTSLFNDFTVDDWLYFLEHRYSREIRLGLVNVKKVAQKLNLLEVQPHVITVGGTNGKGSTVSALESIYHAAGYQVGSYTSPHLFRFNERIRVNQLPIEDEALCLAFRSIEEAREAIDLTYFEMATLAALWHFKHNKLDVIILEVGMGGRLDATNIIDSDLAIITTVDLDHQSYLGDNKETIGYEKAGILRSKKPLIYADVVPPASVKKQALEINSPMYCLGESYTFNIEADHIKINLNCSLPHLDNGRATTINQKSIVLPKPQLNPKAAASAIFASVYLQNDLPVTHAHWVRAMQVTSIQGRQQIVKNVVTTLFDVAHNPQSVVLLSSFIAQYQPKSNVHAVFSALNDKDLCGLIKPLRSSVTFWYPAILSGRRAASEQLLLTAFQAAKINHVHTCYNNPVVAYRAAMRCANPGDLVVVYGSFLTVGAVMAVAKMEQEESYDEICYE
jgi:dihydrofolate synthase/folylpolyglutamate synthase